MDTKWLRNSFVYLIILVAIIALFFTVFQPTGERDSQISLNELAAAVKRGEVRRIDVAEDKLTIEIPGRQGKFTARKERQDTVPQVLANYGVTPDELARVEYRVTDPPQFSETVGVVQHVDGLELDRTDREKLFEFQAAGSSRLPEHLQRDRVHGLALVWLVGGSFQCGGGGVNERRIAGTIRAPAPAPPH